MSQSASLETAPDQVLESRTPSELGAERPQWSAGLATDVIILTATAISARVVLLLLQPGAWYFSDSGDYIATFGWKPHTDLRSPALSWLWHVGGALNYTERNVVLLQMALGVVSVVALFALIRRIVNRRRAFVVALVWSVFPLALLFERTLMPESMCATLLIFFLWLVTVAFPSPWKPWSFAAGVGASFVLSLVSVIIPSLELACGVIVVVLLVFAWRATARRRGCEWKFVARASLVAAMVVAFFIPVVAVAVENQRAFGTLAVDPVSGTYLFVRWAPLVPCHEEPGLTRLANASVHEMCGRPFTPVPGENENEIWRLGTPLYLSLWPYPDLGATQSQLTHLAEQAMLAHPGTVLSQVSESLYYQLVMPPYDDLWQYTNGWGFNWMSHIAPNARTVAAWEHWWGSGAYRSRSTMSVFQTIGQLSYRWPQFLLWALFGALIVRAASRLLRRDRFRQSEDVDTSVVGAEQRAWNEQPRLAVVTAASILIVGSMVSIAVSGLPVFRYKVTLVPMMLVLLAVAMPTTVSRRGRDATPPAH